MPCCSVAITSLSADDTVFRRALVASRLTWNWSFVSCDCCNCSTWPMAAGLSPAALSAMPVEICCCSLTRFDCVVCIDEVDAEKNWAVLTRMIGSVKEAGNLA